MATLQEWATQLASDTDFYIIVVPFVLTFAIIYGLLSKADLFGEKNDQVSAIIGLVAGFLVVQYNPIASAGGATFLQNIFGSVAGALVLLTLALIGAALFGVRPGGGNDVSGYLQYLGLVAGAGVLALGFYYGAWEILLGQQGPGVPNIPGLPAVDVVTGIVLLLGVLAIVYILRGGSGGGGES